MGRQILERVKPRRSNIDQNAWQRRRIKLDARHVVPGQELMQGDGDVFMNMPQVAFDPGAVMLVQRNDLGETFDNGRNIRRLFGHQKRAPAHLVICQRHAETIMDRAPRRSEEAFAGPVALGKLAQMATIHDLQSVEAPPQRSQNPGLHGHDQQRTACEDATPRPHRLSLALLAYPRPERIVSGKHQGRNSGSGKESGSPHGTGHAEHKRRCQA